MAGPISPTTSSTWSTLSSSACSNPDASPPFAHPGEVPRSYHAVQPSRGTSPPLVAGTTGQRVCTVRVPSKAEINRYLGAHDGGWIAALTRKHVKLVVFNLFSGVEVPLSFKQRKFVPLIRLNGPCTIQKIVFSKAPTSSDCILAALTYSPGEVALCRVGHWEEDRWITTHEEARFDDIAFYNRELYGLTADRELFRFEITNKNGATSVVVTRFLSVQQAPRAYTQHRAYYLDNTKKRNNLFVLGGKLAMASTWWYTTMPSLFNVSEHTCDHQGKALKWTEVTSLGEHTLFLGKTFSTTVSVPAGGRGWVERNCIYTANALYWNNGGRFNYQRQENEGHIKVVHASRNGMWVIPPSV